MKVRAVSDAGRFRRRKKTGLLRVGIPRAYTKRGTGGRDCGQSEPIGGRVAVDVGGPLLDLDRRMVDPEAMSQLVGHLVQECVGGAIFGAHEVGCEGRLGRTHGPDMQIVHFTDPR